jgi:hypothetical protein
MTQALDDMTMNAHLIAGARLLGTYNPPTSLALSNWMSTYDNSTPIRQMNIIGCHDSLTCKSVSCLSACLTPSPGNVPAYVAPFVKTQDFSLFDQLSNGVRFVDLRIGIRRGIIRLYHGKTFGIRDGDILH